MSDNVHTAHPDSHENGLADDCPRCAEHAADPFVGLDDRNLRAIIERAVDRDIPPRSEAEAIASAIVLTVLERAGRLYAVAPGLVDVYLVERWGRR